MMNLILLGFKGSGKTYFGRLLSSALGCPFVDTDDILRSLYSESKFSCREIHQIIGEKAFRQLEKRAISQLEKYRNSVIAVGGGSVLCPGNVSMLQRVGTLVYIKASFATLKERILQGDLPSFVDRFEDLYRVYCERLFVYEAVSAFSIDSDLLDSEACLQELKLLAQRICYGF